MIFRKLSIVLIMALCMSFVPIAAYAGSAISLDAISSTRPGGSVAIAGSSTTLDEVTIKVLRPGGSTVFFDIVKVTNGQFSDSFSLGSNEPTGTYTVIAGQADQVDSKSFVVNAPVIPNPPDSGWTPPPSGNVTPPPTQVKSTDGTLTLPAGTSGEVSLDDALTISVPSDATQKDLKITIAKVLDTQPLLTNQEVLVSQVYEVLKNFSENFDHPVTLTFKFDPGSLKGNEKPVVFYYDEVKKEWVKVGGTVSGDHVTVDVNHFTKYAVFAIAEADTQPTDGSSDSGSKIQFNDIAAHWAEASIKQAAGAGFVSGYPDGTFKPNGTVTRAEFAVMLMNALKPQGEGTALTFKDKAKIGTWAQKAVAQAVQAGIVHGYQDGTFRPNAEITRAEMAAMTAKAAGLAVKPAAATGFSDDRNIPLWAKGAVAALKQAGIVSGTGANAFDPAGQTTRAEAVTILLKMLEQKNKS